MLSSEGAPDLFDETPLINRVLGHTRDAKRRFVHMIRKAMRYFMSVPMDIPAATFPQDPMYRKPSQNVNVGSHLGQKNSPKAF